VEQKAELTNAFEFVIVASARAHQLLNGCTPKLAVESPKKARVAMKEVKSGLVRKEEAGK
jgi:DNA-directed RNA polymerase subunit K/omega